MCIRDSNDTVFDPITGDSPRTKVQLGDKLGTTFDITFNMDNYDSVAKTFDVLACLQTDNTCLLYTSRCV